MIHEIEPTSVRDEDVNRQIRHNASRVSVSAQGAETAVDEIKKKDNHYLLRDGEHGGMSLSKPDTYVSGLPGSKITGNVVLKEDARFVGVHFTGDISSTSATSTAMFVSCRFELSNPITFVSGSKAHFVACVFSGSPSTNVITNPGAAANINLTNCSNKTGVAVGTVTSVAVTT